MKDQESAFFIEIEELKEKNRQLEKQNKKLIMEYQQLIVSMTHLSKSLPKKDINESQPLVLNPSQCTKNQNTLKFSLNQKDKNFGKYDHKMSTSKFNKIKTVCIKW